MGWPEGKRRHNCYAPLFVARLCHAFGTCQIARWAGVDEKTIRRWASGEDAQPLGTLERLLERAFPLTAGAVPLYSDNLALDGHTRVCGVGQYTKDAASGRSMYDTGE